MKKLTPATVQLVRQRLPELREKIKVEYEEWNEYHPGDNFNSDEKVIEFLPSSFHEYIMIYRRIYTDRKWALYCLNSLTNETLNDIILITLKRLALIDYSQANEKKTGLTKSSKRTKMAVV